MFIIPKAFRGFTNRKKNPKKQIPDLEPDTIFSHGTQF